MGLSNLAYLGVDPTNIIGMFERGSEMGRQERARKAIGAAMQTRDYQGGANAAFGEGEFSVGQTLANLAFQEKEAAAKQDQQRNLGQALGGVLPSPLAALAGMDPRLAVDLYQADQTRALRQSDQQNDQAWREAEAARAQSNANRDYELRLNAAKTKTRETPSGFEWAPDGASLRPIKGGPQDPTRPVVPRTLRPNNDQNNAAGFYDRMLEAEKILSDPAVVEAGITYSEKLKASAPFGIGNYLVSPEYQKIDQAQRNFINAVLRKESGAAISESEFENARIQYFPQPGDTPEKLKQKAANRATAIAAMKRTAGPALLQGQMQPQDQMQPQYPGADGVTSQDIGGVQPQGLNEADLPNALQEAQDAIAQGANPQDIVNALIEMGVDPQMAGSLLNGQ